MQSRSKQVLTSSIERRQRHIMVRLMNEFEKRFPEMAMSNPGNLFKIDIKHMMNDAIRATRDEINDYDVEYRPLRVREDNTLSMTKEFMETIECIEFEWEDRTFLQITADKSRAKILEALRIELGVGVTSLNDDGKVVYVVAGVEDCLETLPFFDRYRLAAMVRDQYVSWREHLVYSYSRS